MIVRYESNNSGGDWWLTDEQWKALEAAGWFVEWGKRRFCHERHDPVSPPVCPTLGECRGHRRAATAADAEAHRWLGALATNATLECESVDAAVASFERVTGENAYAEGCSCCGQPHYFGEDGR